MPSEDAKTVKKERVKDEDEETLDSLKKKKPNNATQKEAKARKEETKRVKKEEADEDFEQSPPKKSSNKSSDKVQKKRKKEEEIKKKGAKETEQTAKKREKKVYDLPGQRRDPPEERDPLRIFYETLYEQVPSSEMAAIWMMESGLLPKEAAKKIFEKKQKKAQQQKVKSPVKAVGTVKSKADSVTIKKKTSTSPVSIQKKRTLDSKVVAKQSKKCKIADSSSESGSDDDDFILKAKNAKKRKAG